MKSKFSQIFSKHVSACVGMCQCLVALLITRCGPNEFCFLCVTLWLYNEAQSITCMTADVTPI